MFTLMRLVCVGRGNTSVKIYYHHMVHCIDLLKYYSSIVKATQKFWAIVDQNLPANVNLR